MSNRRIRAYVLLLLVTIVWGGASLIIKITLNEIEPFSFLLYRFGISSLIAIVYFSLNKSQITRVLKNSTLVLVTGLTSTTLALGLLFLGLSQTTVLDTSVIQSLSPIITSVLAVRLLNDRITKRERIGTLIAFVGTLFTIVGPVIDKMNVVPGSGNFIGNLFIFGFVFFDALSFVFAKRILRVGISPFALVNSAFIVGFISMIPLVIYLEGSSFLESMRSLSMGGHFGVWYMAIVSGTLAYLLWNIGQKSIEVSEASVFRYLIPFISAPLAVYFLEEKMTMHFMVGAILVFLGVCIAEYKKRVRPQEKD